MNTPEEFQAWAEADQDRLALSFYPAGKAPNADENCNCVVGQGRSLPICVKQGYEVFADYYKQAAIHIWCDMGKHLTGSFRIETRYHYVVDSDQNPWGDYAWLIWRVYKT